MSTKDTKDLEYTLPANFFVPFVIFVDFACSTAQIFEEIFFFKNHLIEQILGYAYLFRRLQAKMQIRIPGNHTSARRAHNEPLLQQIRLQDIFNGAALLADGGRQRIQPDRAAAETNRRVRGYI